jgi:hypothetical protein
VTIKVALQVNEDHLREKDEYGGKSSARSKGFDPNDQGYSSLQRRKLARPISAAQEGYDLDDQKISIRTKEEMKEDRRMKRDLKIVSQPQKPIVG